MAQRRCRYLCYSGNENKESEVVGKQHFSNVRVWNRGGIMFFPGCIAEGDRRDRRGESGKKR